MKSESIAYIEIPGLKIKFRKPAWPVSTLVIVFLIGLVSLLDILAGPEPEFSIFYLVPVTVAVFLEGRIAGLITSVVSAAAWLGADLVSGDEQIVWSVLLWDDCVQLGFFLLHTFTISWLLRTIAAVRALSLRDPLTGAANWRFFEEHARVMIGTARRNRVPLTFAFFDIDNFKRLNDDRGHEAGNAVLKTLAGAVQAEIRPNDMLARLGGDEFGLLLEDSPREDVRAVLDRIVAGVHGSLGRQNLPVTLSVGAITFWSLPETLDELVKEADALMYEVKKKGKNNIALVERR
jgi:diguanylate cyclase (GGDEF)-like protein